MGGLPSTPLPPGLAGLDHHRQAGRSYAPAVNEMSRRPAEEPILGLGSGPR